jgi:hypothetical protein
MEDKAMNIGFKQNTVTIGISLPINDGPEGHVISTDKKHKYPLVLPLYYSLMGEMEPDLAPLSIDMKDTMLYRYDWVVGIGHPDPGPQDWYMSMRDERTVTVQLLVDCGDSGLSFSDYTPMLLGLQPSRHTESWWERNADIMRESIRAGAALVGTFNPLLSGAAQVAANFIRSNEGPGEEKNWWIYRFLDTKRRCCTIEWNISRKVWSRPVTVGRRIAPSTAAPERGMRVSPHTAPQCPDTCHVYRPVGVHLDSGFSCHGNVHVRLGDWHSGNRVDPH